MSQFQILRVSVHQRLTAAVEDILELFERTVEKYEQQLSRQQKLLDAVFQPQVRINRADEEQPVVIEAEWSPGLEQDEPQELPQVKDEQEEVGTSPEGDQFEGLDEPDLIQLTLTSVPVKSEEDDNEEAQSFQHHNNQAKDDSDSDDLQTEAAKNLSEENHLQTEIHVYKSDSSRAQNDNSSDAEEASEPESGLNPLQNLEGSVSEVGCPSGAPDAPDSGHKQHVQAPNGILPVDSVFSCSICGKSFSAKSTLRRHMVCHTDEKPFSCSVCKKSFSRKYSLKCHMTCHSEEKPFSCSVCKKVFRWQNMKLHMALHSKERPFICLICNKAFPTKHYLETHMVSHKEEKPFSCSICKKSFQWQSQLKAHMVYHSEKKMFSCSVCKKFYKSQSNLNYHMLRHSEEKAFSCSICKKSFALKSSLKRHMGCHKDEKL
ncbi:uncharacterized protein V6R79_001405 [Siganus canaliculatus]